MSSLKLTEDSPKNIVMEIFKPFQEYVNLEQDTREDIRNVVRDIEKVAREMITEMQGIHSGKGCAEEHKICLKIRENFAEIRTGFEKLDQIIPSGQYYRYHDHWRHTMQKLTFLAALVVFLEKGILVSKTTTSEIIGVDNKKSLQLDLEDYLMGILNLATELSRFSINSVTFGDYSRPLQVSKFLHDISAGFRLLNMKNDGLRKRYDGLKYDIKKVEEVVYDLKIRGLLPQSEPSTTN